METEGMLERFIILIATLSITFLIIVLSKAVCFVFRYIISKTSYLITLGVLQAKKEELLKGFGEEK